MIVLNIVCDYLDVSLITLYPTLRCFVNVFWGQCLWQTGWLSHWIGCHEQRCSEGKPLQDHSRLETGHCPWCGHAAASQHVQTGRRSTKSQTSINMSSKNILVFDGTIKSYQKKPLGTHWILWFGIHCIVATKVASRLPHLGRAFTDVQELKQVTQAMFQTALFEWNLNYKWQSM